MYLITLSINKLINFIFTYYLRIFIVNTFITVFYLFSTLLDNCGRDSERSMRFKMMAVQTIDGRRKSRKRKQSDSEKFFFTERIYATDHFKEVRRFFLFIRSKGTSLPPVETVALDHRWQSVDRKINLVPRAHGLHGQRVIELMGSETHSRLSTLQSSFTDKYYVQTHLIWEKFPNIDRKKETWGFEYLKQTGFKEARKSFSLL